MKLIENQTFDEERALYHLENTEVRNCTFAGKADGESVLKEARHILVNHCQFSLRYPMWHVEEYTLKNSSLDELTRAPIWYAHHGLIDHCQITGIKILREYSGKYKYEVKISCYQGAYLAYEVNKLSDNTIDCNH